MKLDPTVWFERRPEIGGNALVIKGTRVPIRTLLASLAEGASTEEILADFPTAPPQAATMPSKAGYKGPILEST